MHGKVIVITGASSGLGKGAALVLARLGARLVLAARRGQLLDELAQECRSNKLSGAQAIAVPTDVTKVEEVENLVVEAVNWFGRIDAWVNNAGVGAVGRFDEISLCDHFKVIDTVLNGVIRGSYFAVQQFRKQQSGILINVAALMGKVPLPLYTSYVAANHGVVGLGAALREELKMDKLDKLIHVCTLMPPAMNTPFFERCANYTDKDLEIVPPVCKLQKAIEKLVQLCIYPEAEVTVGARANIERFAHQVAPGLTEAIATKRTKDDVAKQKAVSVAEGNLRTSDPKKTRVKVDYCK